MPKSSRGSLFKRGSGTVTVIEDRVRRSSVRNAKITFWVTLVTVGLLSATVAAGRYHPIVALFVGALIGLAVALPVSAVVVAWPVVRVIWWWAPEIGIASGLVVGWVELADHTTVPYRFGVVALVVGVPAAVPVVRRRIVAVAWCLISRHRIRTCFAEFIITNRTGSLPLILWARPIPVGERVWVWLRPGLSLADLQTRLDKIAAACWASTVTVERASESNSAFVCLDIKRRDALTGTVPSPLLELVEPATVPATERDTTSTPTALDLPDVTADTVTPTPKAVTPTPKGSEKKTTQPQPAPVSAPVPAGAAVDGDDVSDWI